jgi:hypothetical protein
MVLEPLLARGGPLPTYRGTKEVVYLMDPNTGAMLADF